MLATQAQHPAAEWAQHTQFDATQVDCTTTVVLKILDGKCKMLPGEKTAVMAVYDVVRDQAGALFDAHTHQTIAQARAIPGFDSLSGSPLHEAIHELRVEAEAKIPKPVMKAYKAVLREGLFG